MEGEDKLRKDLVDAYLTVDRRGLMRQASGNVSCRFGDGMLISCSGADADNISSDRVVYVNGDGEFCGDIKLPQSGGCTYQYIKNRNLPTLLFILIQIIV